LKEKWTIVANDARMDYLVRDVYKGFRGNTIKISLNVEYMPIVGFFFKVFSIIMKTRLYETTYQMPLEYINAGSK
jgi:hypothetical protein